MPGSLPDCNAGPERCGSRCAALALYERLFEDPVLSTPVECCCCPSDGAGSAPKPRACDGSITPALRLDRPLPAAARRDERRFQEILRSQRNRKAPRIRSVKRTPIRCVLVEYSCFLNSSRVTRGNRRGSRCAKTPPAKPSRRALRLRFLSETRRNLSLGYCVRTCLIAEPPEARPPIVPRRSY